jgi:hypothetical protein
LIVTLQILWQIINVDIADLITHHHQLILNIVAIYAKVRLITKRASNAGSVTRHQRLILGIAVIYAKAKPVIECAKNVDMIIIHQQMIQDIVAIHANAKQIANELSILLLVMLKIEPIINQTFALIYKMSN